MALATKCPHCNTVFRVAHDQLKLRGGIVRCGACNEIFDGNAALIEPVLPPLPQASPDTPLDLELDIEPAPADIAGPEPVVQPEFAAEPDHLPADAVLPEPAEHDPVTEEASTLPEPRLDSDFDLPSEHIVAVALDDVHGFDEIEPESDPAHSDDDNADFEATRIAADAAAAELLTGGPESALLAAGAGAAATADETHEEDQPEFIRQANRREHLGRNARVVMRWGTPLLAILLLVQLGTTFRNPLAARYPALAPALSALCAPFMCKVELPMQIDTLAIEQGELQTLSDNTFSFATVLRNGSRTAQAWPHIELVLNDTADKPVLRRVFAPRDYLGNPADLKQGFRPRSEQPVKLYFELARLKASGYHIAIFYP